MRAESPVAASLPAVAGQTQPDPDPDPDPDPAAYGEAFAACYDRLYPRLDRVLLRRLLELARSGPVLELGAGTGRAVLPLAERGLEVWALDASTSMLARLRQRSGARAPLCVRMDMAAFDLPRRFALITLLVDTLDLLPPSRQAAVFTCVARHLAPRGVLLVERFGETLGALDLVCPESDATGAADAPRLRTWSASDRQHCNWARAAGLRQVEQLQGPGGARHMLYTLANPADEPLQGAPGARLADDAWCAPTPLSAAFPSRSEPMVMNARSIIPTFEPDSDDALRALLAGVRRIAVLGIKTEAASAQPAYYVPDYLQQAGFELLPVPVYYPEATRILGQAVFRRVQDVPGPIDLVCVFRRPQDLAGHLEDLLAAAPQADWLQSGIRSEPFAAALRNAGIAVVQDRCLMVEHRRLCAGVSPG